ncbi:hypothetical protein F4802DRAFT_542859 [Xylaria palmicola]|nr:hypothetical protein F4802DRAFT_542859 [Xylaria palmicola]
MKLHGFLLPALAGVAAADSPQHAEAYMLRNTRQTTISNPPSIPAALAEAILLQRLSSPDHPSALGQIPQSLGEEEAVSYINAFAKPPRPLFDSSDTDEPKQLVIAFSGITPKQHKQLRAAIPRVPLAFTAPALGRLPVETSSKCAFGPSINPKSGKCWSGKTQYLHYDAVKDSDIVKQLSVNLASLKSYANDGLMETTIVFLGESTSNDDDDEGLRRRQLQFQKERVMGESSAADTTFVSSTHKPAADNNKAFDAFAGRPTTVPGCFASQNACETATSSCSGHGVCVDRWGKDDTDNSCFFCHCGTTVEKDDKGQHVYRWGGATCQKQDISTPFWLFVGVTIALVGTVAFSIGLLFSVGEEKLPGVIGAGVSRSK